MDRRSSDTPAGPAWRAGRRRAARCRRDAGRLRRRRRRRRRRGRRRHARGERRPAADRRRAARRRDRRRRGGHDRRAQPDRRHRHHALLEPLRVARGPHARLLRAADAARRVDRARGQAGHVDGPAQAGRDVPQRQAGHGRRRDLLAQAHPRPEGPQGRRGVDRLHHAEPAQEDGRPHRPDQARVPQLRLPGRPRPVLQRDRPDRLRRREPGRHGPVPVQELHGRPAERVHEVRRLPRGRQAVRRLAHDHRLPRRRGAHQRAARRAGRHHRQPAGRAGRERRGEPEPAGALVRDRRVAAVHDARSTRRRSTTCACARRSG